MTLLSEAFPGLGRGEGSACVWGATDIAAPKAGDAEWTCGRSCCGVCPGFQRGYDPGGLGAPAARARAHFCWIFKRPRAGESPTFPGPERRVSHVPLPAVIPLSRKQGSGFEHKARELPALPQLSLCALRVRPSRRGYRYPPPVAGAPGLSSWDFKADAVQGRPLTRRDGEKRPLKAELPDS